MAKPTMRPAIGRITVRLMVSNNILLLFYSDAGGERKKETVCPKGKE